ncbi:LysR family transcriptional regulator [Sporosarcina sp. Te-1]|uniref:LysR family transcriptional regulator n=1 Tax=Sporosarcina sp. Te-1 TaxID=2818390 RepID=UPI001A9DDDB7|nr:LysR family transcriptional regulator [Sporosarcina sp. Te-1]QTD41160.1 LysR family transcriptional regulator [Sporosarcina sp. Te-1]
MDYQWLTTFIAATEELNFRKASERLSLSQPSVTVHIRLLEEHLGLQLFDRLKNRVTLTDAGKLFYVHAVQLIQDMESTIESMHSFAQGYRRTWSIAISPLMAETMLPYFLRTFQRKHPDVELSIQVEESEAIEGLVDSGDVHLGISALKAAGRNVETKRIYEDPVVFVMPVDSYDEESGPPIDVVEVLKMNYLLVGHHPVFWNELLPQLKENVPGIRTMKVTQAHIAKRFIQEGLGVSFLPLSIVRRELIEGRLMQPHFSLFELPKVSTYAVWKRKGELEEEFMQHISQYYLG